MRLLPVLAAVIAFLPSSLLACASPLHARQNAPTTCGPIITALVSYGNPTPFCSSYLGMKDDIATDYETSTLLVNRTVASITGTNIITASSRAVNITITAIPSIVTYVVATSTLTFCNARFDRNKRLAVPQIASPTTTQETTVPQFGGLPYYIQPYAPPDISSACSCLSIPTNPDTVTSTQTVIGDHVFISGIAANITATPYYNNTVTATPISKTQVTLYATYLGAPVSSAPVVYLPSPTALTLFDQIADDIPYTVDLPFPVTFYDIGHKTISISPNGWIGLTPDGGDGYQNTPLPSWNDTDPTSSIPSTTLLPFWDDLLIVNGSTPNPQSGLSQGISYSVQGDVRSRNITFEWVAGKYDDAFQHYRFWVTFYEDRPNMVTFTYWDISDLGGSATVGAQSEQDDMYTQYSLGGLDTPSIYDGLVLNFDIADNKFIPSSLFAGMC